MSLPYRLVAFFRGKMEPTSLTCEVTLHKMVINGKEFSRGEPLDVYEQLLGQHSRSDSGPPAPYGQRNNVLHFYDDLGLLLNEHHASYMIQGVNFQLESQRGYFPAKSVFTGKLRVCGVEVTAGMAFSEFASRSIVEFRPHLGHAWYADGKRISIQFEVYKKKFAKLKKEIIWEVCVGFAGAHNPRARLRIARDETPPEST